MLHIESNNKNIALIFIITIQIVSIALFVLLGIEGFLYNAIISFTSYIITTFYKYILLSKFYYHTITSILVGITIFIPLTLIYYFNEIYLAYLHTILFIAVCIMPVLVNSIGLKNKSQ